MPWSSACTKRASPRPLWERVRERRRSRASAGEGFCSEDVSDPLPDHARYRSAWSTLSRKREREESAPSLLMLLLVRGCDRTLTSERFAKTVRLGFTLGAE